MTIEQLFYTSCRHPLTGRTGFQIKAASPGVTAAALDALQRALAYRLPPALLESEPAAHPVALRYMPLGGGQAALVCIHSGGLDEFDRPGNYFAHAVFGPAEQIARVYPPITYWNSPFWVRSDETSRTELPASDDFGAETAFDYDAVWPFLDEGPRRAWFRALLSAVVDAERSGRRIVIVDSAANTALWVYAVSLALPSRFRPMLSFATYHHDPLTAAFVIAGTTANGIADRPDGPPRFVLDAASGAVDAAPPSPFAAYICEHFTPDGYEVEILEFLDWAEARDDRASAITHLLDDLALFYLAARQGSGGQAPADLERAARYVLEDAARTAGAYPQDAADLRAAAAICADLLAQAGAGQDALVEIALTALAALQPALDAPASSPDAAALLDALAAALSAAAGETPAADDLYRRIAASPRLTLTAAQRAAFESALALHSGRFPGGAAAVSLRERLETLDTSAYHAEAERLLDRFFAAETHPDLVRALYARPHRDEFWALYWQRLGAALLDEQRGADAAAVLDVWFARSGALADDTPYALPEFFLQLPAALDSLRADRRYAQVGRAFEAQLAGYDWYPLVQKTPPGRAGRGLLSGLFER